MCPLAWKKRYLDGFRGPPNLNLLIGHGLHGAAEVNFKQKITSHRDEPEDVLTDAAADAYEKRGVDEGVMLQREDLPFKKRLIADGKDTAVELARLLHSEVAPTIQPILVEQRIKIPTDDPEINWLGYLDIFTDKRVLTDLKTAKRSWRQEQADGSTQGTVYPEMVRQKTGAAPDQTTFTVFVKKKTPVVQVIERVWHPDDFAILNKNARIMKDMIRAGLFPKCPPGHWKCDKRYCDHWWGCSAVPEHKKILSNV